MIGAQGRFFLFDELVRRPWCGATGCAAAVAWFLTAQGVTLTALYGGAVVARARRAGSPWTMTAWLAALTLRHRIAAGRRRTRSRATSIRACSSAASGWSASALLLHGRPWWALALAAASAALHPTTAACFVVIIGTAIVVTSEPKARLPLGGAAAVVGHRSSACRAWQGGGLFDLTVMDAGMAGAGGHQGLHLPDRVELGHVGDQPARPGGADRRRRSPASAPVVAAPAERGVLAGCLLLVAGFLASLPLVERGVALAVQLQTSRVFWPVELLATLYGLWWLAEAPAAAARPWTPRAVAAGCWSRSAWAAALYVGFVEHPQPARRWP